MIIPYGVTLRLLFQEFTVNDKNAMFEDARVLKKNKIVFSLQDDDIDNDESEIDAIINPSTPYDSRKGLRTHQSRHKNKTPLYNWRENELTKKVMAVIIRSQSPLH